MDHSSIQIKFNESSWPHLSESFLSASGTVLSAIRIAKPGTGGLFPERIRIWRERRNAQRHQVAVTYASAGLGDTGCRRQKGIVSGLMSL